MKGIIAAVGWWFRGIKVFALVGKSGTGKSFRARLVMERYAITLLIDDGLLINKQHIVSGISAKREAGAMEAVRTALFHDPMHRKEVRLKLGQIHFKRILVIGTSLRMVKKICNVLQIPEPHKIFQIEDIATAEEISTAIKHRNLYGHHIIPVPSIEVRRNYPQIVKNSIKVIWQRGLGLIRKAKTYEKTLVQPAFSKKGEVSISKAALTQMIMHCVKEYSPFTEIIRVIIVQQQQGYNIDLFVNTSYKQSLPTEMHNLQQYIVENIGKFSGIIVNTLNIIIENMKDAD